MSCSESGVEFLIIRHAESMYNKWKHDGIHFMDSSLTSKGMQQANECAEFLKNNFDLSSWKGVCSPYRRTCMTAEIIGQHTGVHFKVDERIGEYAHVAAGFKDTFPLIIKNHSGDFNYVTCSKETSVFEDTEETLLERINSFLISHKQGKYIVISHGVPCHTMFNLLNGNMGVPRWDKSILNTSVTWMRGNSCEWFAKFVNSGNDPREIEGYILDG